MSRGLHEEIEPLLHLLGPLNDQLDALDDRLAELAHQDDTARRLMIMPVAASRTDLHRRLGVVSIVLAVTIVISGAAGR